MPRKKPFSTKQKKKQLQDKRERKRGTYPPTMVWAQLYERLLYDGKFCHFLMYFVFQVCTGL